MFPPLSSSPTSFDKDSKQQPSHITIPNLCSTLLLSYMSSTNLHCFWELPDFIDIQKLSPCHTTLLSLAQEQLTVKIPCKNSPVSQLPLHILPFCCHTYQLLTFIASGNSSSCSALYLQLAHIQAGAKSQAS